LAYARHVQRRQWHRYLGVTVLFALALLAKPMMVTLPCLMLLLDYWPLRRTQPPLPDGRGSEQNPPRAIAAWLPPLLEQLPWLLMAGGVCWIALAAQAGWGATRSWEQLPLTTRGARAVLSYALYVAKFFWPTNLAVFYPLTSLSWEQSIVQFSLVFLVALSAAALWLRERCPYLTVGWCWYLSAALPVIGLVQVGNQAVADRYTYLPSIGLAVAVAWTLYRLSRAAAGNWINALTIAWVVVLGSLTWNQ